MRGRTRRKLAGPHSLLETTTASPILPVSFAGKLFEQFRAGRQGWRILEAWRGLRIQGATLYYIEVLPHVSRCETTPQSLQHRCYPWNMAPVSRCETRPHAHAHMWGGISVRKVWQVEPNYHK